MALSTRQHSLIDDFLLIEDPQERLGALIDRARRRPSLPATERTERTRVHGCQSQVWVKAESVGHVLRFTGDSDSPLVRGLVTLVCDFFSDEPPGAVAVSTEADDPLARLGLTRNLSPTRLNGLAAVRARIRELAALT